MAARSAATVAARASIAEFGQAVVGAEADKRYIGRKRSMLR